MTGLVAFVARFWVRRDGATGLEVAVWLGTLAIGLAVGSFLLL